MSSKFLNRKKMEYKEGDKKLPFKTQTELIHHYLTKHDNENMIVNKTYKNFVEYLDVIGVEEKHWLYPDADCFNNIKSRLKRKFKKQGILK